ncbi:hypothetical protein CXT89_02715 [Akkermansia muciniphila]|nr:hypothetical protein CXT89_02715 [Akkermansia muciniphila]
MCASLLKLAVCPISGKFRRPPYHGRTPFFIWTQLLHHSHEFIDKTFFIFRRLMTMICKNCFMIS